MTNDTTNGLTADQLRDRAQTSRAAKKLLARVSDRLTEEQAEELNNVCEVTVV